ncbi:putative beta-glucosidase I [Termitomyces sp. T112]|nr:putative beta-glucosidase I [Termitomyces sp. T112]
MSTEFDVDATLAKLSLPNKIKLLTGLGWWHTEPVPEAGVPSMRLSDGPNGVRGTRFFNGVPSNCFPASTGLGSSFDIELAHRVGEALGDECRAKGTHVLLAPTVNTQRSPLGGRGFESFSEDPHLNGTIAAAYINGLQSKGVSATIKHYVANDQEFQRFSISSEVSERALREIYLKPFQIAIKNANPWALMSSYNRVNGLHVSENKRLLDDILRKEWGYQGLVMSDWTGVYSTVEAIKAGLDLEMPGPSPFRGKALERSIIAEKLFPEDIDVRVRKVLELIKHAHASGIPFNGPEETFNSPEIRQILRTAAADAIVLLKNDKKLLPLRNVNKIAVIGPNAKYAMTSGGGSARLLSTSTVSPLEGITSAVKELGGSVTYTIGATSHKYLPLLNPYVQQPNGRSGLFIEFWNESPSSDYTTTTPNFLSPLKPAVWSTPTSETNCFMMDGIDESKVNSVCWMRFTAKFSPDQDGDWELGLSIAGRGNLFLDQKLIIDLSEPVPGKSFFGLGTSDVRAVVKDLKAGRTYDLELRLSNAEFAARGSPFVCWGGVRLGGMRQISADEGITDAVKLAKDADAAILVVGLNHDWESEGFDRTDMELPGLTNELVSQVLRANPNTVVVNQSGTPVAMPWIDQASTVLQAFYGGDELGNGLADVLFGKVNPSGKLPLTFPKRLEDSPSYPSYGHKGQEYGKVLYNEGIFVGYRGFEVKKIAPLFPFGFGLSYTQFKYSNLVASDISSDGTFTVTFDVENTGDVQGREIAQIYITDEVSSLPRPIKELKAFIKVDLQPGETKKVTLQLDREALGFYDDRAVHWIAEGGKFKVLVAASSADVRLTQNIELTGVLTWDGL